MKKLSFLLVFILFFSFSSYAQITLTPRLGATFSTINFGDYDDDDSKKSSTGLLIGAELGFNVSDLFSVQTGLNFTQKGVKYEDNDLSLTFRLNYIELPLLARVNFGSDKVKAYVNAGPSLGFALGGKYKVEDGSDSFETDITFGDGDDDFFGNSIDLGLQFGAGIGYSLGPGQVVLDLRYGLGISNLYKTSDGADRADFKSSNNVFAISLGYAIPLGGQ